MKRKQLLLTLFVLISNLPLLAQETDLVQKLVISKNDKTEVSFLLSEEPKIKFSESDYSIMVIVAASSKIELSTIELKKMTIVSVDNSKIDDLLNSSGTSFTWQGDALLIEVNMGETVMSVYSIDGKQILSRMLPLGRHALSLSSLPKGACVIKINDNTFKIWNR